VTRASSPHRRLRRSFRTRSPRREEARSGLRDRRRGHEAAPAFLLGKHDTVGIDCVAMCVNDIICCGASRFFPGLHRLRQERAGEDRLRRGRRGRGLRSGRAALIGGETAEMPGFYPEDDTTSPDLPSASWIGTGLSTT
jgi:hypothetical protein